MPTREATIGDAVATAATASGAKLNAISADTAAVFLARLGERGADTIEVALGGFESDGSLIGVATLGATTAGAAPAIVVVALARRRLSVGSDLLHALVGEAARRGIRRLRVNYPAHTAGADALLRSSGLVTARRIVNGVTTAVLIVPDPR